MTETETMAFQSGGCFADLLFGCGCRRARRIFKAVVVPALAALMPAALKAAGSVDRPLIRAALAEGVFELADYRGMDGCIMLSNGDMEVILAGNYTRRVLSIRAGGVENLAKVRPFRNDGVPRQFLAWLPLDGLRIDAFGPNGESQQPPFVYQHHELVSVGPRSVAFQSPPDAALEAQMLQTFEVAENENALYWTVAIKNLASEPRKWSVWFRNELESDESFLVLPLEGEPGRLLSGLDAGAIEDAAEREDVRRMAEAIFFHAEGMAALAPCKFPIYGRKVASFSRAGWAAAVRHSSVLSVSWPVGGEGAEYFMKSPFATWLQEGAFSMELESPRAEIPAGGTHEFRTQWRVFRLRKPVAAFEHCREFFPHIRAAALKLPAPRRGVFKVAVGSSANSEDAVAAVKEAFAEARAGLGGMEPHTFYFIDGMKFKRFKNIEAAYAILAEQAGAARLIGVDTASYQALSHKDFLGTGFTVAAFAGDISVEPFYVTGLELKAADEKNMGKFERERHQALRVAAHREKGRELARKVRIPVNEPYFMLWASTTHTPRHYWVYAGFLDVMGIDAPCAGGGLMCTGRIYADGKFHEDAAMVTVLSGNFDYGVHCAASSEKGGVAEKTLANLNNSLELLGNDKPDFVAAYFCASWSDQYNEKGSNVAGHEAMTRRLPGVPIFGRYCAGELGQVRNNGPNFSDAGLSFILCVKQRNASAE